ncbi:MAG: glycosyl hydrolase 53 family protein [Bacteroidota bacterium]
MRLKHLQYILLLLNWAMLSPSILNAQIAKGADVGWLSYFEDSKGIEYVNDQGQVQDAMEILRDHGMNAIRLRAMVNPTEENIGNVDTQSVVNSAVRANNLGMDVMITIHYSDVWADPGSQHKPVAWEILSFNDLSQAIYDYTYGLMDALLNAGVAPKWVQVGNETNPGFLWEDGRLSIDNGFNNMNDYVTLSNRGYDAIKDRSPSTLVITHLSNGNNPSFFQAYFDEFYAHGGKNDVIGMSYYPYWNDGSIEEVGNNMNNLVERFNKDVMICEIGNWEYEEAITYNMVVNAIDLIEAVPNDRGLGVFYWEPIAHTSINGYPQGVTFPYKENQYLFSWSLDAFLDSAENCEESFITPNVQIDNSPLEEGSIANGFIGGTVTFDPESEEETGWSWIGPNGFTANTREIVLSSLEMSDSGYYVVTYNPTEGCQAMLKFLLNVYEVGEIIIENPGFETGALAPWSGTGNYGIDTDLVNSGTYSGWFGGGDSELRQTITGLLPNTTYEYSCFIRNATGDNGVVKAGVRNFGGTEATTEIGLTGNNGNDFELAKVSFTTGSSNVSAVIYASTTQAQTWGKLDDVRVVTEKANLSIEDIESDENLNSIKLYPNPTYEIVSIRTKKPLGEVKIIIYSVEGRKMKEAHINSNNTTTFSLPIPNLEKGTYFLSLEDEFGTRVTKKLLIK